MELIKTIAPVLLAAAVAVVMIMVIRKKRKSNDEAETYMAEGIALGLCLGAGIGSSIPGLLSYFISIGTLIGFLVGMQIKKYLLPVIMLAIFDTVAVMLRMTMDNLFYLFNFSYIGFSIAMGIFLFIRKYHYARQVTQLSVGLYMLLYLGLACHENMQIEGFWYYLFTGVFEAATIHYAVAKIFGPLIFGRGWCGYACCTAMVLDFLPYKVPKQPRKKL